MIALLLAGTARAAEPLIPASPFPSSGPVSAPGVSPSTPTLTEPRRDPVPPPVGERIRRDSFERRERAGETNFGDVLLEQRRRRR